MAGRYNASAQGGTQPGKVNNAKLPDISSLIAAGIDPRTGLPLRMVDDCGFKPHNKRILKIIDEQDAINRYKWTNLPNGLNQQLIERVLYYKGQGMFFYESTLDRFFFLPYALNGKIDVYGRFTSVTPLPFNGSTDADQDKALVDWMNGLVRTCVHDIFLEEVSTNVMDESCVLLWDHCIGISQMNTPREIINDPLIDVMADCIPFLRTALLNSTGIEGMRVPTENEQSNVEAASASIDRAALTGRKFIPIIASLELQEITGGEVAKSEEFLLTMQGLDNYRLSTYGLKNGGLFQKKAHMLQDEQDAAGISNSAMEDGLWQRQHFCDIVNSIWGLGIWCEIAEPQIEVDRNGDGEASENETEDPEGDDNAIYDTEG